MGNFKDLQCGCDRPKPVSGMRPGSHSHSHGTRSSFTTGRPGLRESRNIDFAKPAFGSVQVGEGQFFWVAFRSLSDWMECNEPLDSGYLTNEQKAHGAARAAVRYLLNEREMLAPMPEAWVEALHRRLIEESIMQEQVTRYMAVLDREEDGTIAGYDWEDVCQANDYDLLGFDDPDLEDSLQSIDVDIDQAA
jgi:hypothetical protein